MPPQYYILTTLADILQGDLSSRIQRARLEALSKSAFGDMVVRPQKHTGPDVPKGLTCLTYPGDEATGGPKGRLHRSYIHFVNGVSVSHIPW